MEYPCHLPRTRRIGAPRQAPFSEVSKIRANLANRPQPGTSKRMKGSASRAWRGIENLRDGGGDRFWPNHPLPSIWRYDELQL